LPDAALIPKAVERYLVGKTSPGTRNVVVLGPKFWKKLHRQYSAKRPPVGMAWKPNPMMEKRMVRMMNPPI